MSSYTLQSCSRNESNKIAEMFKERIPFIIRNVELGNCVISWKDAQYLISNVCQEKTVTVHVSKEPKLNFISKNFHYKSCFFNELIKSCFLESHNSQQTQDDRLYYYLRALGENQRSDVANFFRDFPSLANDVNLPKDLFTDVLEKQFSSVLRVSSNGVQLWTHYDIMDNVLLQIVGSKKVALFNPNDVPYLYLQGDKSLVVDIENPDLDRFPLFSKATKYIGTMEPGDVLYIPALWFHNTTALTSGIGLNIFWRHLDQLFYDPKDVYGNRDLLPAQRALQSLDKIHIQLKSLPEPYKRFYALRIIENLKKQFDIV